MVFHMLCWVWAVAVIGLLVFAASFLPPSPKLHMVGYSAQLGLMVLGAIALILYPLGALWKFATELPDE